MLLNGKIYIVDGSLILALEKACDEINVRILNEVSKAASLNGTSLITIENQRKPMV